MKRATDNKFKEGQVVFSIREPSQKLIVRRFIKSIYYCRFPNEPDKKELVFFERELDSDTDLE